MILKDDFHMQCQQLKLYCIQTYFIVYLVIASTRKGKKLTFYENLKQLQTYLMHKHENLSHLGTKETIPYTKTYYDLTKGL